MFNKFVEQYRRSSTVVPNDQDNGYFVIPHPKIGYCFFTCFAHTTEDVEFINFRTCPAGYLLGNVPTDEEEEYIARLFWNGTTTTKTRVINSRSYPFEEILD